MMIQELERDELSSLSARIRDQLAESCPGLSEETRAVFAIQIAIAETRPSVGGVRELGEDPALAPRPRHETDELGVGDRPRERRQPADDPGGEDLRRREEHGQRLAARLYCRTASGTKTASSPTIQMSV